MLIGSVLLSLISVSGISRIFNIALAIADTGSPCRDPGRATTGGGSRRADWGDTGGDRPAGGGMLYRAVGGPDDAGVRTNAGGGGSDWAAGVTNVGAWVCCVAPLWIRDVTPGAGNKENSWGWGGRKSSSGGGGGGKSVNESLCGPESMSGKGDGSVVVSGVGCKCDATNGIGGGGGGRGVRLSSLLPAIS